ncbi:MAG: cryptochrome/photolyase family protein, partial [Candidatus Omnitrophica bacterium]|nr:cryptochrome/photolyase family protein [Candidatus Omnitrophota bacterium]
MGAIRNLIYIFGDQLDLKGSSFEGFDPNNDRISMGEVEEEATSVWSHKIRLVFFFSAMRHFRDEIKKKDFPLDYQELSKRGSKNEHRSFREHISTRIDQYHPEKLVVTLPGDYRVLHTLRSVCGKQKVELEVRPDTHFLSTPEEFEDWAEGKKSFTMEYFYRTLRKKHDILMDEDGKPVGGDWNFDQENRETFGKEGPSNLPDPPDFQIDDLTQEVMEMVESRFGDHPGNLEYFNLPVTRKQSLYLLRHFTDNCLKHFGKYQDALWTGEPFLYHSRLSAPLNVKLIHPREVLDRAIDAAQEKDIPLNSLEGFVRQVLGWREFVRGVYWMKMPEYASLNALDHHEEIPSFFWDGETDMECVRDSMKQVLD